MLLKDVLFCQIYTFVHHGRSSGALYIVIVKQTSSKRREKSKEDQCENISIKEMLWFAAALWISSTVWSTRTKKEKWDTRNWNSATALGELKKTKILMFTSMFRANSFFNFYTYLKKKINYLMLTYDHSIYLCFYNVFLLQ